MRIAREARGWRLEDLSERCGPGFSPPKLSNMEHGYAAQDSTRRRIAEVLELPVEQLWPAEYPA